MRRSVVLTILALVAPGLAGCFGQPSGTVDDADGCEHPFPCGDEAWPAGLTGPFDLLERVEVDIPSHDGVILHGWLWRPGLPEGVGAPTILMSTPYLSAEDGAAQMETLYEPPVLRTYIPNGYAFLVMEVRGTGGSGGCFGHHDMPAQLDPAALVDWIVDQPWSNGRVGMAGISYMGVTAIHGALHAGPALKAIAPVAVPQQYLYHFTPQGAFSTSAAGYEATQHTLETPPFPLMPDLAASRAFLGHASERWCSEYLRNMVVEPRAILEDDRDAEFWTVRDSFLRYPNITAAVFLTEGFHDPYIPWGQDVAWDLLQSPKRILFGQWGHEMPPLEDASRDRLAWFDHWLKGTGAPPRLGIVDLQDDSGAWHVSSSWPPKESRDESLYFRSGGLGPAPAAGESSYRSTPVMPGRTPGDRLCDPSDALRFDTAPLQEDVVIAGNPMAWLSIEADGPSGLVGMYLYRIAGGGACHDAELLTWGAADLRFHAGNLIGEDFPVATPTSIRFDMEAIAARVPAGDRLAVLLTHPGPYDDRDVADPERVQPHGPGSAGRIGRPAFPVITLHATNDVESSHLLLPLLEGSLGGATIDLAYPDRPFSGP